MKRLISIIITMLLTLSLIGCSGSKEKNELLNYIDTDMAEYEVLETQIINSMNSIISQKLDNDMLKELATNTMNLTILLNDKAVKCSYTLESKELKDIHEKYIEYTNSLLSAFSMLSSAIQTNDTSLIDSATKKFEEADTVAQDYLGKLQDYAKKHDVELKFAE